MDAADETLVHVTTDAPWLPPGGRAEVVRRSTPPRPISMVRLLFRSSDEVFCVRREETGRLDLPTRRTDADDPDGSTTIRALAAEVVGPRAPLTFVGAVRNIVEHGVDDYPWPIPVAYFGVWTCTDTPTIDGTWVASPALRERHWYPLLG